MLEKIVAAVDAGLTPLVCVRESERNDEEAALLRASQK
jgi:triosephosphate isomerase